MRIVRISDDYGGILSELGKIKSNSRGKMISSELIPIEDDFDWKDKNVFIALDKKLDTLKDFNNNCRDSGKEACFIIFSRDFSGLREAAGIVSGENILGVGVENLSGEEISFIAGKKIRQINLNQIEVNLEDSCDSIMEFSSGKELFLCFDVSVLGGFGGLGERKALYILGRMGMMKNLKAVCLSGDYKDKEEIFARLMAEII